MRAARVAMLPTIPAAVFIGGDAQLKMMASGSGASAKQKPSKIMKASWNNMG